MCGVVRAGYLTDVRDGEWLFVLPYLLLSREDNASRQHDLRAIFNAVRYVVKGGKQWRLMPNDLPPWPAAYQQMQRWLRAGCFERTVEDVQLLLRQFSGRKGEPTAVCIDTAPCSQRRRAEPVQPTTGPSGARDRTYISRVDTLGHLMALTVIPADQGDRTQVETLSQQIQQKGNAPGPLCPSQVCNRANTVAERGKRSSLRCVFAKNDRSIDNSFGIAKSIYWLVKT